MDGDKLALLTFRLEVSQQDAAALACLLGDVLAFVEEVRQFGDFLLDPKATLPRYEEVGQKFARWNAAIQRMLERIKDHPALIRLELTEPGHGPDDDQSVPDA